MMKITANHPHARNGASGKVNLTAGDASNETEAKTKGIDHTFADSEFRDTKTANWQYPTPREYNFTLKQQQSLDWAGAVFNNDKNDEVFAAWEMKAVLRLLVAPDTYSEIKAACRAVKKVAGTGKKTLGFVTTCTVVLHFYSQRSVTCLDYIRPYIRLLKLPRTTEYKHQPQIDECLIEVGRRCKDTEQLVLTLTPTQTIYNCPPQLVEPNLHNVKPQAGAELQFSQDQLELINFVSRLVISHIMENRYRVEAVCAQVTLRGWNDLKLYAEKILYATIDDDDRTDIRLTLIHEIKSRLTGNTNTLLPKHYEPSYYYSYSSKSN
ncbi:hypothetical protein LZ30DRAFT_402221 [Colletotrichum cereale]|nr:hypothetical protein LZ30DRAFT_402221 [Colletotrichum cereale]